MSRVGISPTRKNITSYQPAAMSVAVLLNGCEQAQAENRLMAAFEIFLESVWEGASKRVDVLVWEQGCSPLTRNRLLSLQEDGLVQYLFYNKLCQDTQAALWTLLTACPGEHVLFLDGNGLLLPGWQQSLAETVQRYPDRVLAFYPPGALQVGMTKLLDAEVGHAPQMGGHSGILWLVPSDVIRRSLWDDERSEDAALVRLMKGTFPNVLKMEVGWAAPMVSVDDESAGKRKVDSSPLKFRNLSGATLSVTLLEKMYDALFWFLTDARKEWIELDTD